MTRDEGNAVDGSASEWKPLKELGEAERNLFQQPVTAENEDWHFIRYPLDPGNPGA